MKKRIAALVLAASAMAMTNINMEKVLANELGSDKTVPQTENINKAIQKAKVINVTTSLRVRESASTSAKIVGNLRPNAVVNIQGQEGDWYKINYNGMVGYAHSDFLQELSNNNENNNNNNNNSNNESNKPNTNTQGQVDMLGKKGQVINVTTSLRIRQSASTSSSIIGYLYADDKVDIIKSVGSWYEIKHHGKTGYVHKDYLKIVSNSNNDTTTPVKPQEPEVKPQNKKGQVINVTTSLRVRQSASTSSNIVGYLYADNKVDIIGEVESWYQIKLGNKKGFVHKNYIKLVNSDSGQNVKPEENKPESPDVTHDTGKGKVINVTTNLRVRSMPNTSSSVVGYLTAGNIVDIQGKSGSWYKISYNGKVGFVHSDYIKRVNDNVEEENSNTQTSNKFERVLSIMKAHVGTPYIFGGSGEEITTSSLNMFRNRFPDHAAKGSYNIASKYINSGYRAFDCSGLMQWSFRQVGISLGRTTYDQINSGYEVSTSSVKPGDLLFFRNLGHVGMYIGNGQWIESPKPGTTVRITNVPWNLIGRARRIL